MGEEVHHTELIGFSIHNNKSIRNLPKSSKEQQRTTNYREYEEPQNIQFSNMVSHNINLFEDYSTKLMETSTVTTSTIIKLETLQETLSYVKQLPKSDLFKLLKAYRIKEDIFKLLESQFELKDLYSLCALTIWISNMYKSFGTPLIDITFEPETNDFQFISIILPECNWAAWRQIARDVKKKLIDAQLSNFASKVAIVCLKALTE